MLVCLASVPCQCACGNVCQCACVAQTSPNPLTRARSAGRLVGRSNTALQLLYPPLMAISVGCILGLDGLMGLGDPAVLLPGTPVP